MAELAAARAEGKKGVDVPLKFDPGSLTGLYAAAKVAMQRAGLADLLDYGLSPSQISTRLQLMKRMIGQYGISDMLDANVSTAGWASQLAKLRGETIPLKVVADTAGLGDLTGLALPKLGETVDIGGLAQARAQFAALGIAADALDPALASAQAEFAKLGISADALHPALARAAQDFGALGLAGLYEQFGMVADELHQLDAAFGASMPEVGQLGAQFIALGNDLESAMASGGVPEKTLADLTMRVGAMGTALDALEEELPGVRAGMASLGDPAVTAGLHNTAGMYDNVAAHLGVLGTAAAASGAATAAASQKTAGAGTAAAAAAVPLSTLSYGWGRATGNVKLFGGALTAIGIPAFIASAGAVHLLTDAIIETVAVVVPASLALGAFGVAAIPTIQTITAKMQAVNTTSEALGQNIYPLTGGFSALAQAAQPGVYQLFGEALVVATQSSGKLIPVISQVGSVLDTLGARAAVALTSGGFGTFLRDGPKDLAMIGDIIGNIFGSVGNLLKVVPRYAQTLLGALDGVTKGLEAVTASPITQWITHFLLIGHGFLLWGGLAATAAVGLGNALIGLAAKFGLAEAGALAFDAAQFGTGIKTMLGGIVNLGGAMIALDGAEAGAAVESGILAGALAALDAVNPLVWVGLAAAAIGFLVYEMTQSTTATQAWDSQLNNSITSASGLQTGLSALKIAVQDNNQALGNAESHLSAANSQLSAAVHAAGGYSLAVEKIRNEQQLWGAAVSGLKGEQQTLNVAQGNYNSLLKVAGGNQSFLTDAGITWTNLLGATKTQLKQYALEVQAASDAQRALGLGIGRSAAAQQAQTNDWMTNGLPAMQKVISAEDAIITMITGGQTAFNNFQQSIQGTTAKFVSPTGLADAFKLAGGNLSGLGQQSLAFSNMLYSSSIPALQTLIDKLQMQNVSTGDLTKVVGTGSGQILQYVGSNKEARSVIVDLINNALGPGTVSLQTLNTWVKHNSVSLGGPGGFSSIVAAAAVNAGKLAGVLQTYLTGQFIAAEAAAGGAGSAIKALGTDMGNAHPNAVKIQQDAQALYNQLVNVYGEAGSTAGAFVRNLDPAFKNTGNAAQTAAGQVATLTTNVGNLQTALGKVPKNTTVNVQLGGGGALNVSGALSVQEQAQYLGIGIHLRQAAKGMLVTGGTPGSDSVPILAMPGEAVVPVGAVPMVAPMLAAYGVPGFAAGGVVGSYKGGVPGLGSWYQGELGAVQGMGLSDSRQALSQMVADGVYSAVSQAVHTATAAAAAGGHAGPGGGAPAANAALARRLYPQYAAIPAVWDAWNYVAMRESGWNQYALNASSGAYGIAQALPPTKYPFAGQAAGGSNPTAQITWMWDYMASVYGGPQGAAAHEQAYNWYDSGGSLPVGLSMALNTTGKPETVVAGNDMSELIDAVYSVAAQLDSVISALHAAPARTGAALGHTLSGVARSATNASLY